MVKTMATRHADHVSAVLRKNVQELPANKIFCSWLRCLENYRIDPAHEHHRLLIEEANLLEHQERLQRVLPVARFEMNNLYQQIAGSGFVLLFTDKDGVVIHSVTDGSLIELFTRAGLWTGAVWSEDQEGTNAIGTCLVEKQPLIVHRDEHFRTGNIALTCSAAPVFDPHGNLLGVLDASSVDALDSKQSQFHTLALANLSAQLIENCVFLQCFRNAWVLRFHSQPEYANVYNSGLLAFDEEGRILAVNDNALRQLNGASREQLLAWRVVDVFDVHLANLMGQVCYQPNAVWPIYDRLGHRRFAMVHGPERYSVANSVAAFEESAQVLLSMTLEGLKGNDPLMAYNVRCAQRVMNKAINILLIGETGTGKEAFAKAIHDASNRANKPFVAVNCASIPENLIESELFGYKYGAFTGARREGMRGKVLQASGGTLFLDEIGDMPLALQTRLLRVLEEKQVLPLGSENPISVDLHIISATHHNLQAQVAVGEFREDLYYRLNGLTLNLPALRERADRVTLMRCVLTAESEGCTVRLDEETFAALNEYPWPGNIRQLRNVLRTAVALCEGGVIRLEDLPTEIAQIPPKFLAQRILMPEPLHNGAELVCAEKEALLQALDKHRWNISQTSAHLGLSRNTLYRKLRKHGISKSTSPSAWKS